MANPRGQSERGRCAPRTALEAAERTKLAKWAKCSPISPKSDLRISEKSAYIEVGQRGQPLFVADLGGGGGKTPICGEIGLH
jgi:hypothetical protein